MTISEWRLKMSENNIAAKLKGIEGAADAASSGFNRFQDKMNSVKNNLIGVFSIGAIAAMGKEIYGVGSEMEQLNVSFKTMLGSQAAATAMMEDIKNFSATTPFEMPEVAKASKQLLAFGIEQKKVISSLRMLGDVGSGIGAPIGDLAYLFGTIKTQGRAMTMDINQFANRGIPIWDELSKITGKNSLQLRKYVEEGKIGFPQIEQAFANMSGAGGKFFNLMEEQSATSAGKLSNTMDKLKEVMNKLFLKAQPAINNMIAGFGKWMDKIIPTVEWLQKNWKVIKALTFAIIAYKITLIASNGLIALNTWLLGKNYAAIVLNTLATEGFKAAWVAAKMAMAEAATLMGTGALGIALGILAYNISQLQSDIDKINEVRDNSAIKEELVIVRQLSSEYEKQFKLSKEKANELALTNQMRMLPRLIKEKEKQLSDLQLQESKVSALTPYANGAERQSNQSPKLLNELQNLRSRFKALSSVKDKLQLGLGSDASKQKPSAELQKVADEISAGGKSVKNITVNIKTLNEGGINISTTKLPEAQSDIERQFMNWFLRAIQGAELAVANE